MGLADVPDRVGGYGPTVNLSTARGIIGISYDAVVEDIVIPAQAPFGLLPRNLAGDPIMCTFPTWNDGDVLEVDLDVTPEGQTIGELDPAASFCDVVAIVSLDGGVSFQFLLPSQSTALATVNDPASNPNAARSVVTLAIPGSTPPIIQIAFDSDGGIALGGVDAGLNDLGSAHLKCTRMTPDTLDSPPTGVLFGVAP